jgi:hypothetical protein
VAVERRIVRYVPITTFPRARRVQGGRWIGKTPFFHPYSGGVDDLLW